MQEIVGNSWTKIACIVGVRSPIPDIHAGACDLQLRAEFNSLHFDHSKTLRHLRYINSYVLHNQPSDSFFLTIVALPLHNFI